MISTSGAASSNGVSGDSADSVVETDLEDAFENRITMDDYSVTKNDFAGMDYESQEKLLQKRTAHIKRKQEIIKSLFFRLFFNIVYWHKSKP